MASRKLSPQQRAMLENIQKGDHPCCGMPSNPGYAGGSECTYRSLMRHDLIVARPAKGGFPQRDKLTADGRNALKTGRYEVPPRC